MAAPLVPDPFDLTLASPLPEPTPASEALRDPVLDAWRRAREADAYGDPSARVAQRLELVDAWVAAGQWGCALEILREAEALQHAHPGVMERKVQLFPRAGLAREAAQAADALATARPSAAHWHQAAVAWARADDLAEARRCAEALVSLAPDDPRGNALAIPLSRLQLGGDVPLPTRSMECALNARRRDDREAWRTHALDAWIESQGREGGEMLAEALAATGHPRAAVYVAAESAARAALATTPQLDVAARLLERCAKLAEGAGMPGEATAAWAVRALLPDPRSAEAREALRDLLAERGRSQDLAARLRADARRAAPSARSASWKGVAAIEIPQLPSDAAFALVQALSHEPEDREAMDLLEALVDDPGAEPSVRDALWLLVRRTEFAASTRTRWLLLLGRLEERAGDFPAADAAYALVDEPATEAFEGLARVDERSEEMQRKAERALSLLGAASGESGQAALEQFLSSFGSTPGAFRDAKAVAKYLGPFALHDDRAAQLWLRSARRSDDPSQLPTVLRRLATRCAIPAMRARAAVACAELLDETEGATAEAAEVLALLLDELPDEPSIAATLAALAEHAGDASLSREALRALARAATDPWERDLLGRFTGHPGGIFQVFAACLTEPTASRERAAQLARMNDLLGDSAALLAQRTRALLAQTGPLDEGMEVARRFSTFDPLSPEAAIAWFGAANLAGDAAQIARAARAVAATLAPQRDVAAVARAAVTRLVSLAALSEASLVVLDAARGGAMSDRGLRAAATDLAGRASEAEAAPLLEALCAAVEAPAERIPWLRRLAAIYRARGATASELGALWRLRSRVPAETRDRLLALAPKLGDRVEHARLLTEKLEQTTDVDARRALHLAVCAELAAADPPRLTEAAAALDRVVQDRPDAETQADAVRALLGLGMADAAVGRLARWAAEADDLGAVQRFLCAARVADDVLKAPERALSVLLTLLRRNPGAPGALRMAEEIAARSGLREAMLGIYEEMLTSAAGSHGRHALVYRRAAFLEQVGDLEGALLEHVGMFERNPGLGASFTAIERLAAMSGRRDLLLRTLDLMAHTAPSPEVRARFYLNAADVAREHMSAPDVALRYEVQAWQSDRSEAWWERALTNARALKASRPADALAAFESLIDDELSNGNQAWEDERRQHHARRALDIALRDARDPYRASVAIALLLRNHDDPEAVRNEVRALVTAAEIDDQLRSEVLSSPAMKPRAAPVGPAPKVWPATKPSGEYERLDSLALETVAPPPGPPLPPEPIIPVAVVPVIPVIPVIPEAVVDETFAHATPAGEPPADVAPGDEAPAEGPPSFDPPAPEVPTYEPPEPRTMVTPAVPATASNGAAGKTPPRLEIVEPAVASASGELDFIDLLADPSLPSPPSPPAVVEAPPPARPPSPTVEPAAPASVVPAAPVTARMSSVPPIELESDEQVVNLARERQRFVDDPTRVDALDGMIAALRALRGDGAARGLEQVRAVLTSEGEGPDAPALGGLGEPPEGLSRVLFPPRIGPFPELGALLWEAMGPSWRRDMQRASRVDAQSAGVFPSSAVGKLHASALRLLQLPRTTALTLGPGVDAGATVQVLTPAPTVHLDAELATDTPRTRVLLGRALEGTRLGHLPMVVLPVAEGDRLVLSLRAAFGRLPDGPLDPQVGALAGRLVDGIPPRLQKRIEALVQELGDRLVSDVWREAVAQARTRAGLLVSGSFATVARQILDEAPLSVSRAPREAMMTWEPLRGITRFAVSEEYLLIRWSADEPRRRR